jgi:8-oxo-dGTP pyrophosphatase MutT (NUDIX family)
LLVPGGRAVVTDAHDRVLFHRRSDLGIWDLPGGGAELGESMPDAVVREVHEETGLTVEQHVPIGLASDPVNERVRYPNGDIIQGVSLILWVTEWSGELRLSSESTELTFHDPADVGELRPNIAATLAAFEQFKATGEFQLF